MAKGINNTSFNQEGFNKLVGIASSLIVYAKNSGLHSLQIDYDDRLEEETISEMMTIEKMDEYINEIYDKSPSSFFSDSLED